MGCDRASSNFVPNVLDEFERGVEPMLLVGTLLLVHGDDVEEVRQWAAGDPYNSAGLFETVTVAPLNYYAVDPRAHM